MGSSKRKKGVQALRGPQPVISLSENTLNFPDTVAGEVSAAQSILVSGVHLIGDISIPLTPNMVINQDGSTVNAAPFSFNGAFATAIYFRFAPSNPIPYDITTIFTSPGAAPKSIDLTGNGIV